MEEAAGGGPGGGAHPPLQPEDREGAHPVPRGTRRALLQPERTPSVGLLQLHQLPAVLVCSLHKHVEITDDRLGVKKDYIYAI